MLQWFLRFSEFTESSAPFRENSNIMQKKPFVISGYSFQPNLLILQSIFRNLLTRAEFEIIGNEIYPVHLPNWSYGWSIQKVYRITNIEITSKLYWPFEFFDWVWIALKITSYPQSFCVQSFTHRILYPRNRVSPQLYNVDRFARSGIFVFEFKLYFLTHILTCQFF